MRISVVTPVFNDARALPELMQRLFLVMDSAGLGVELIIVDDCSILDVWSDVERARGLFPDRDIVLFQLPRNVGQHRATLFGIRQCRHEVIVTMDSDLQHPPEEVARLVSALAEGGLDLVYGEGAEGHPLPRRVAGYLFSRLGSFSRVGHVRGSAFRAMTCNTAFRLAEREGSGFLFIDAALAEMDLSVCTVKVEHHRRKYGKSSYSICSMLLMAARAWWFHFFSRRPQGDE